MSGLLAANYSQAYPVDKQAINGEDTVQLFANSGRRSLAVIPFRTQSTFLFLQIHKTTAFLGDLEMASQWPASVTCTEGQNVRAAGNYKPSNDVDLGVDHLRWPCSYSPSRNPDALQANLVGPAVRPANGARASGKPALPRYSASTAPHDKSREMADLAHRLVHRVAS